MCGRGTYVCVQDGVRIVYGRGNIYVCARWSKDCV